MQWKRFVTTHALNVSSWLSFLLIISSKFLILLMQKLDKDLAEENYSLNRRWYPLKREIILPIPIQICSELLLCCTLKRKVLLNSSIYGQRNGVEIGSPFGPILLIQIWAKAGPSGERIATSFLSLYMDPFNKTGVFSVQHKSSF